MKQGISPRVLDACGLGRAPRGRALLGAATLMLVAALWTSAAEARRIYVDQNGVGGSCSENRDWATAQNPATPVCSIETGIALAQTGDTVMVRGGRYLRSGPLGTGKSNFALMAYPGEHVTLDFSAATSGNGINFNVNYVLLEGFEITNAPEECVSCWSSNNLTIRKNHIHHCGLTLVNGKYQNAIASYGNNLLVEQNEIHDTGSHCMYITGDGITIRNNLIYRTIAPGDRGSYGIQLGTGQSSITHANVTHNIISESVNRSAITLYSPSATVGNVVIANNVLMNNAMYPIYVYTDVGTTFGPVDIRNNVFSQNASGNCVFFTAEKACLSTYPNFTIANNQTFSSSTSLGFRDLANRDYYPLAGSPLLNAALPGYAAYDYVGTMRPQGPGSDIGPFEALVGGPDMTPPAAIKDLQ
jgi:hypothetical protein